jgi:class 3 adenylate cyclase/tetratricopeptide (TPR) repeat protein/ribosomal protein L40E
MLCAKCESDMPPDAVFCMSCGAKVDIGCSSCGTVNPADANFCRKCGASLGAAAPIHPVTKLRNDLAGERRHLTVLFCDLVGSTEIASHLDPEEWREIVREYHRAAAKAIERFGGSVAQYLGDGVMAYFGWPAAHDNDAERSTHAGLAILSAVSKLNRPSDYPKLSVRIGIDSGAVVVGESADRSAEVFGDTPNIAARVQAVAQPGTVLITDAVHRLVSGLLLVEDCGAQALKGIERPLQLYRVVQPSGVRGRLQAAAAAHGLTPFIGREDELRSLTNRWERALEGEGQTALIIGEAGIGKSRLVQQFHEQIAGTPHSWVEAAAGPFFQNTPFHPVIEMLRELLAWRGDEPADEQLAQLESALEFAGLKPADAMPLIAPLLNLSIPAKFPPLQLSSEQQRRRLLATLVEWALGAARAQPTVIITEDLHWADPSTLELLQLLVEQGATARLLLLYTARPEFRVPWPMRTHHTQITLNRLSARNARTMVGQVAAQKALTEDTVAAVIERTGGVPLFVEELTRAVLESGDAKLTGRQIPVTLHDSLMARLDRLGSAREVAQVGSVIGSEFSYELLRTVHPIPEEELQEGLRKLADAELIYVHGIPPEANYTFKHALVRDAAYEALLKSRRRDLHRLVASTINDKFSAFKETHPEVLARHWTEAGEIELAIAEWSRAGKAAQARSAFWEAQESYEQAMALVTLLPDSPERDNRELDLRQSVIGLLYITRGFAASETKDAIERAATLAEKSGNLKQLISSVSSRVMIALFSGDLPAAAALADQALELALREGGPTILGVAHQHQVMTRFYLGDFAGVEEHFKAGLQLFDAPGFNDQGSTVVAAYAFASWNARSLGRFDVARERIARMMTLVNASNPYEVAFSWMFDALHRLGLREYEQAEASAARALDLAEKHQIPQPAAYTRFALGQARAQLGRTTEGIALIRQGLAAMLEIGMLLTVPYVIASLAEAQEREGLIADALETVEQSLEAKPKELLFYRPEALRLRGELRRKQGQMKLAESDFRESIALAQKMRAKHPELRSTMSLARLLDSQGKRAEGRAMLAEIYDWFTEGFDTADLKDAKTLLDELSN